MFQQQNQQLVLDRISQVLAATADTHSERLTSRLDAGGRVFIAGAGRSKLVGSFFAMRLMHGGYNVSVVGEIVTPSIQQGDLLLVISGSGETQQLLTFTRRAAACGATVALITARANSTIGELADEVFLIGSPESYAQVKGLPMGTVFELSTLCFLEALIAHIIWDKGIEEEHMQHRHANLE